MWRNLHKELNENEVENLNYDHPLSSEILNISLKPFINLSISESDRKTFQKLIKKYNINEIEFIKQTCVKFMKKTIERNHFKLVWYVKCGIWRDFRFIKWFAPDNKKYTKSFISKFAFVFCDRFKY